MRRLLLHSLAIILCLPFFFLTLNAQITLDYCQTKAREHYPLVANYGLIEKTKEYNLENANKSYLPQLSLSAKATIQSEVTNLPIKLPFIEIPELNKDQYQATLEVSQIIWDGGMIKSNKDILRASSEVEKNNLELNLYGLKDRISELYFGILLIKEQIKQAKIMESELNRNLDKVKTYIDNGVANLSDENLIRVEILNNKQKITEAESRLRTYCKILSTFIGQEINQETPLDTPSYLLVNNEQEKIGVNFSNRPELKLFDSQYSVLESNKKILDSKNLPKIGAFAQGGYGRPGLNMLTNEFSFFAIAGLRLNWNFGNLYTMKNENKIISNNQTNILNQKETFVFNTNMMLEQQKADIQRLKQLLITDNEIISLRESIKKSTEYKVENGTKNINDLMQDITYEDMAKQTKILREIQLLMSIYRYNTIINE